MNPTTPASTSDDDRHGEPEPPEYPEGTPVDGASLSTLAFAVLALVLLVVYVLVPSCRRLWGMQ